MPTRMPPVAEAEIAIILKVKEPLFWLKITTAVHGLTLGSCSTMKSILRMKSLPSVEARLLLELWADKEVAAEEHAAREAVTMSRIVHSATVISLTKTQKVQQSNPS
jgi:hypothetical protein